MTRFQVRFTPEAEDDLLRLWDFQAERDPTLALKAQATIAKAIEMLEMSPFSYRKAAAGAGNPLLRELVIPFGHAGYVALFEIDDNRTVTIIAVRHQREDDYH